MRHPDRIDRVIANQKAYREKTAMTDTQALIGKPFRMEFARKLVNSKRHQLPPYMQVDALDEIDRLTTALTEAEAKLAKAREALTDIGVYGCGMLSQPAAMNGPEAGWLKQRVQTMEQTARACLAELGEG